MININQRHQFNDAEQIFALAWRLANYFPKPEDILIGIHELLLNAVEHGNLGLGSETKAALLREGTFGREISRRLRMPAYAYKSVHITLQQADRFCRITIQDEGGGFNWRHYMGLTDHGAVPYGRGLMIASRCGFDSLMFNDRGNAVTCTMAIRPS
jgi:anti-sigma regulatory factor (Ser/Thr protein kinase)